MKRRDFIKRSLLVASGLAIAPVEVLRAASTVGGEVSGVEKDMPLSTNASTLAPASLLFKKSMMWGCVGVEGSVLDKCKAVKAAGFHGIEPNSGMDRAEVLDAVKQTGLEVSSVCNSAHWASPLSHPDVAVRQKGIEGMVTALEDAKAYGTDAVLLVPGVVSADVSYDDCWRRSSECIKELEPVARKLGVKIAVENVWNNFLLSPMEAARYVDQFDSKWVGSYFDIGNILVYGWPEQWIKILGDRIVRIHLKEFSRKVADEQGRWAGFSAPLGDGDVDWPKVMEAIRMVNYRSPWLTIEHHGGETSEGLCDLNSRWERVVNG